MNIKVIGICVVLMSSTTGVFSSFAAGESPVIKTQKLDIPNQDKSYLVISNTTDVKIEKQNGESILLLKKISELEKDIADLKKSLGNEVLRSQSCLR